MPFLKFKHSGVEKLKSTGLVASNRGVARLLGVDPATMTRALAGTEPNSRLVAGVLSALGPEWFNDFFEVVNEGDQTSSALNAPAAAIRTQQRSGAGRGSVGIAGARRAGQTMPLLAAR